MLNKNLGSFRDRNGYVFHSGNDVLRTILPPAKKQYEAIRDQGLIEACIKEGLLIGTKELKRTEVPTELAEAAYVVQHEKIPYISYPYEWSFYQLKAAALHHLKLELFLLDRGALLRDASAYNVQFLGPQPIFIDLLSIAPYEDGDYWIGHRQFCEQFLNPLLLRALKGVTHFSWYRGNLEGIPLSDLARLLSIKDKLSWRVLLHVVIPSRLETSAIMNPGRAELQVKQRKPLPRAAYKGLLTQLYSWIKKLEPKGQRKTVWGDYANSNTYLDAEAKAKRNLVVEFAKKHKPMKLIDLGCNTGDYSIAALEGGAVSVVGYDFDPNAIDIAFIRSQQEQLPFLPIYLDAANPSPDQGWMQSERAGFGKRAKADSMIALALIHHLVIGKNIPLEQALRWMTDIAPKGLIEFVPKNDQTVCQMLALREDIFDDYTEENFIKLLSDCAEIRDSCQVSSSGRKIFEFSTG
jgi:ribosomal protein L11 methylase PrmA